MQSLHLQPKNFNAFFPPLSVATGRLHTGRRRAKLCRASFNCNHFSPLLQKQAATALQKARRLVCVTRRPSPLTSRQIQLSLRRARPPLCSDCRFMMRVAMCRIYAVVYNCSYQRAIIPYLWISAFMLLNTLQVITWK